MTLKLEQVYADFYTEAELRAMKAFFTSPEGQSMMAKEPKLSAGATPLLREMQDKIIPHILHRSIRGNPAK